MARITLDNIAHSYGAGASAADFAVKPVDFEWEDGGAYALLGPSGCGKTTLLNIISGLLVPTQGRLLFDQQDVTSLATEERNIAQVFQFPVVYDTMTVAENLAFPLVNAQRRSRGKKLDKTEIRSRVQAALEMLDLAHMGHRKARNLNADDKQKISLGRGLVRTDVNAILFDEPLTVIDPHMKWQLRTHLKQLHRRFGHTMVYVTHDQTEALTFADTVVVMKDGAVLQTGTPEELFNNPQHTFVGNFIGSPGMNVLPCQVKGNRASIDGRHFPLPREYGQPSGRVEIGVRPEFISFKETGPGLPVQVRQIEDLGRYRIVRASFGEHSLDAVLPEGVGIPSEPVAVFETERLNVYCDSRLLAGAIS